jgi:hypothetical protein
MEPHTAPRIVSSDRLDDGILVSFDDGKSAVFSAALLYANLSQAEEVSESEADDES